MKTTGDKAARRILVGVPILALLIWLIGYVSEREMRRLDNEMERLCAKYGKSEIYETVKLPAANFNKHGQPKLPQGQDESGFGYYVQLRQETVAGRSQEPGARLLRQEWKVIRTADGKVMAEHIYFNRGGGNWQETFLSVGSGKLCPGPVPVDFVNRIFLSE